MSWRASAYVKTLTESETGIAITRAEKLVLMIMADYHNEDTGYAHPSIETLAHDCLYEPRQIVRIIHELEKNGFIKVERSANKRNRYFILGVTFMPSRVTFSTSKRPKMSPEPQEPQDRTSIDISPIEDKKPVVLAENMESMLDSEEEVIYQAYPRKVGREAALHKIRSSLKKLAKQGKNSDWLLQRVQLYAEIMKGKEKKFIPYPETWFNQGRYDDNPDEWREEMKTGVEVIKPKMKTVLEQFEEQKKELEEYERSLKK